MSNDAQTTADDAPKKKKGGFMKMLLMAIVLLGAGGGGTYAVITPRWRARSASPAAAGSAPIA